MIGDALTHRPACCHHWDRTSLGRTFTYRIQAAAFRMGSVEGREGPKLVLSPVRAAFAIFAKFANFKCFMSDRVPRSARVTTPSAPVLHPGRRTIKAWLPSSGNTNMYPAPHR
jgi:hypothetical protein